MPSSLGLTYHKIHIKTPTWAKARYGSWWIPLSQITYLTEGEVFSINVTWRIYFSKIPAYQLEKFPKCIWKHLISVNLSRILHLLLQNWKDLTPIRDLTLIPFPPWSFILHIVPLTQLSWFRKEPPNNRVQFFGGLYLVETWLTNSLNLQEPKIRNQIESIRKKIRGIGDTGAWY
jgi:hypothetical protein